MPDEKKKSIAVDVWHKRKTPLVIRCGHCSMPSIARCDYKLALPGTGVPESQWPQCSSNTCPRHTWTVKYPDGKIKTFCPIHRIRERAE